MTIAVVRRGSRQHCPLRIILAFMIIFSAGRPGNCGGSSSHIQYSSVLSSKFIKDQVIYNSAVDNSAVYRLDSGLYCPDDVFAVNPSTGNLVVLRNVYLPLDHGTCVSSSNYEGPVLMSYICPIIATSSDSSTTSSISVVVDVVPDIAQLNEWKFSESTITGNMYGTSSLNLIYIDQAITAVSTGPTVSETISSLVKYDVYSSQFVLQQDSLQCVSVVKIYTMDVGHDQHLYNLTLSITTPSLNHTSAMLLVESIYVNEHAPQLMNDMNALSVSSDTPRMSVLTRINVTDDDNGPSGTLRYTTDSDLIGINPVTGDLMLLNDISTANKCFNVTVSIYDLGVPVFTIETTITIFIVSFDRSSPSINITDTISVSELTPLNTTIATILKGNARNSSIKVSCAFCDDCFELSSQDNIEYNIQLARLLNYEQFSSYNCTVTMFDGELLLNSEQFEVNVLDGNEPPKFTKSHYFGSVSESGPSGMAVLVVMATDEDTNGSLVYSIDSENVKHYIDINPHTGLVYTITDRLDIDVLSANVSVTDGTYTAHALVTVSITPLDINSPLFSLPLYATSVYENISESEPIFTFKAVDNDKSCEGAIEYSILQAEPPHFVIDSVSGLLYVKSSGVLDYEQFTSANISVLATSLGKYKNKMTSTILMLTILNSNDNRPIIAPVDCPCFVKEEMSQIQSCNALYATDNDGDTITYEFSQNSNYTHLFQLHPTSGIVYTTGTIDHEAQSSYELDIVAFDGLHYSDAVRLVIQVIDINDSPPMYSSGIISISLPKNSAVNEVFANVRAEQMDVGINGLTEYKFGDSTPQPVTNTFSLDPPNGDLSLINTITLGSMYTFNVIASDVILSSQQAVVSVEIVVVGDANLPPYFILSYDELLIATNLPIHSTVATIHAVDDDTVSYGLSHEVFEINSETGIISLSKKPTSESYSLNISAADSSFSSHLSLKVKVYESTVQIYGSTYTHNSGVGVCLYTGYVLEGNVVNGDNAATMATMQSGHEVSYEIIDGSNAHLFKIDKNRLLTSSQSSGDRYDRTVQEAFYITVRATYGGSLFHLCAVTIIINDTNDRGPVFDQEQYHIDVYQVTPVGAKIYQLKAIDADTDSNALTVYTLVNSSVPFSVDSKTGNTIVTGTLSEELYTLVVIASDLNNQSLHDTAQLVISVLTTANNPPVFTSTNLPVNILETEPVNSTIIDLQVSDVDRGSQGALLYCIVSNTQYFTITNTGQVVLKYKVDYEKMQAYNVSVMVYDVSPNPEFQVSSFLVQLEDVNDGVPTFLTPIYSALLMEGVESGTHVLTVTAQDSDNGNNGKIRYNISSTLDDDWFSIDPMSGAIVTTMTVIDRESLVNDTVSFTVAATDQSGNLVNSLSSTALVNILILDINDFRPNFEQPIATLVKIPESTTPDTVVSTVRAIDKDSGLNGEIRYTIQQNNLVHIDAITGDVILTRAIDYEDVDFAKYHELQITVTDLGAGIMLSATTNVTFEITDLNDNHPIFTHDIYYCEITENTNIIHSITFPSKPCHVEANDLEIHNSVLYSITEPNSVFIIDSIDGSIRLREGNQLNHEYVSFFIITVMAQDNDALSPLASTAQVFVYVENINDEPPVFDSSRDHAIWIPEALPVNSHIFTAQATDADENDKLQYNLLSSTTTFNINETTGGIFIEDRLYYTKDSYSVQVLAVDGNGNSALTTYLVNVLKINNNPAPPIFSYANPLIVSASASATKGTVLTQLNATDTDYRIDNSVEYHLMGKSYFAINKTTGELYVSQSLVYLSGQSFPLQIIALDNGSPQLYTTVNITVVVMPSLISTPVFTAPQYDMTVSEAKVGTDYILGHILALVNDRHDSNVVYGVNSTMDGIPFAVNSTTGAVYVNGLLDRETTQEYFFRVTATHNEDNVYRSLSTVKVSVTDTQDYRPNLLDGYKRFTISSAHNVGDELFRLFVIDKDGGINSVSTFTLTSDIFTINSSSGVLSLQATPSIGTHNLTITANNNIFVRDLSISVDVVEITYASIVECYNSTVTVREDISIGTIIHVTNVSTNGTVFYSLNNNMFAVHPSTGEVFLTSKLDREIKDAYSISVIVWDGRSMDSTVNCHLAIHVTDVNDNRPIFANSSYHFDILENSLMDTVVGCVHASDEDSSALSEITYVIENSENFDIFMINSSTGCITVVELINREALPDQVLLTISANDQDGNQTIAYAYIEILDTNDNAPLLEQSLPNITIMENATVGTFVFTIRALDIDIDSKTQYVLTNVDSIPFAINSSTGVITTAGIIDYEHVSFYHLNILAMDVENPLYNDSAVMYVSVYNIIDTYPELNATVSAKIGENLRPHSFVTSVFVGVDSPLHPIIYSLMTSSDYFYIEPFNGVIRTLVELEYEEIEQHNLTVMASYSNQYYKLVNVTIEVLDINDNSPETTPTNLTFTVSEGSQIGTDIIFDLQYFDIDTGSKGVIKYVHILDPVCDSIFHIDVSGAVTLKQSLDRESQASYHFDVFVIDSGLIPKYLLHSVYVLVDDVNDNPPLFDKTEYEFVIEAPVILQEELFQVTATDADERSFLTYQITNNVKDTFTVDELTGVFIIHDNLNLKQQYTIDLNATDQDGLTTSVVITVNVEYCRFNNLSFQPFSYSVNVPESTKTNQSILNTTIDNFNEPAGMFIYTIASQTIPGLFGIDSSTGVIHLESTLDYEMINEAKLLVQVQDINATDLRIAEAPVFVSVIDVNDNYPKFIGTPYAVFLKNNTIENSVVFNVSATDIDTGNSLTYSISSSTLFDINKLTGAVSLIFPLTDVSHGDRLELTVTAYDNGKPSALATNTTLTITVLSSNAPSFSQSIYLAEIPESTVASSVVITIEAMPSNVSNAVLFYSVLDPESDPKFPFQINSQTGNLSVNDRGLNYENTNYYRFFVEAEDTILSLSTKVEVQIFIKDVNDEAPEFSQPLYVFELDEDSTINTSVGHVTASDSDTEPFAQINYYIAASTPTVPFSVDPSTGLIYSTMLLDYETVSVYQFTVYANDSGPVPLQGTATVRIIVNNINDNPPVLHPLDEELTVPEYPSPKYLVAILSSSDIDDDLVLYTLASTKGSENFIVTDGGLLRTRSNVTLLTESSYEVIVVVSDGIYTVNQSVFITVLDSNDNSPVFSEEVYYGNITENSQSGVFVTVVNATDADRGLNAKITYSGNLEEFIVNSTTGIITTSEIKIDRETNEMFSLIIIATDGGDRTDVATVIITVRDENDNHPQFTQSSYITYLQEERPDLTPVITVNAIDTDEGKNGTVTYEITTTDTVPFAINSDSGLIYVLGTINYEDQPVWRLNVTATDGGGLTSNISSVTINLVNIADANPQFSHDVYESSVPEYSSTNHPIFTPNVTYPDTCINTEFSIFDSGTLPFRIDEELGTIKVNGYLQRTVQDKYAFDIVIRCSVLNNLMLEDRFDNAAVQITVTDVNERPSVQLSYSKEISESAPINTTVIIVQGSDTDLGANGTLQYNIIESNVPFSIGRTSGIIKTDDLLDREAKHLFLFNVIVTDLGSPQMSRKSLIFVTLTDENDSPPSFTCNTSNVTDNTNETDSTCLFDAIVPENYPNNIPITTLPIEDPDLNGNITFQITSSMFTVKPYLDTNNRVTGGVVYTLSKLDRETNDQYTFETIVNDGVHTANAHVSINVTDVNDESPTFLQELYEITINENYPINQAIVTVNASDNDEGMNAVITYALLSKPQLNNITINSTSGEIYFLNSPDYEVSDRIDLLVQAHDIGDLSDTVSVVISIQDVNDNAPIFDDYNYTASIEENSPFDTFIHYITATDADSDSNGVISYRLKHLSKYFQINQITGQLTSKEPLDREMTETIELTIVAEDLGSPSLSSTTNITISVLDVNDNAPLFVGIDADVTFFASVFESAEIGDVVFSVNVTDSDNGPNAVLIFHLTGENNNDFDIITDGNTLVSVTVAQPLNHESISNYDLVLSAIDSGIESLQSDLNLSISVTDVNDNIPIFERTQYETTITEDYPQNTTILTVKANDLDSNDAVLIYTIAAAEDTNTFSVNPTTGGISAVISLDYETVQQYVLTVVASEQRLNPQTAETRVVINIDDINDNSPVFICDGAKCLSKQLSVTENQTPPTDLGNFTVIDIDTVTNINDITFDITFGNETLFTIDPLSAQLTSLTSLDREHKDVHYLEISACDNGAPLLCSYLNVTIIVNDVNDNGPIGDQQTVYVYLYDKMTYEIGNISFFDQDIINNHHIAFETIPTTDWIQVTNGIIYLDPISITEGMYTNNIRITDMLYNGTITYATTVLNIYVQNVTTETTDSSINMVISDMNIEIFVKHHLTLFTAIVTKLITDHLNTKSVGLLYAYSVTNSDYRHNAIELQLAYKLYNQTYLHKDLLLYYMLLNRDQIQNQVNVTILTEHLNQCSLEPCTNNGICSVDSLYEYHDKPINKHSSTVYLGLSVYNLVTCECNANKTGETCSKDRHSMSCDQINCGINGHCVELPNVVGCECENNYAGEFCNIPLHSPDNLCDPDPCNNTGTCTYGYTNFTCTCTDGFTGKTCSELVDISGDGCHSNPCLHGGMCINQTAESYTCKCPKGYVGKDCQAFIYYKNKCPEECNRCIYTSNGPHCITNTQTTCTDIQCSNNMSCIQIGTQASCVDECMPNPCINGGECVRMYPGHHCKCPKRYTGPNCELLTATFHQNSFVLFPSLSLVAMGGLSLEFATESANGSILYVGRSPDGISDDHIFIYLLHGYVHCEISLGRGESTKFVFNEFPVNTGNWYTISFQYATQEINAHVVKFHAPYQRQTRSVAVHHYYYLDVSLPIIIGQLTNITDNDYASITGCIQNIIINGKYMDFTQPLLQQDIQAGCTFTERNCDDHPCANGGECMGLWSGHECVCTNDFVGSTCSEVADSAYFTGDMYLQYQIIMQDYSVSKRQVIQYSLGSNTISLSFSAVTSNGILLQVGDVSSHDHLIIKLIDGHIGFDVAIKGAMANGTIHTVALDDGYFHNISLIRIGTMIKLLLDDTYSSSSVIPGDNHLMDVSNDAVYLGNDDKLTNGYIGCMIGVKFDNKDLPVTGMNDYFISTPSEGTGMVQSCDGSSKKRPLILRLMDNIYVLAGISLCGLVLFSVMCLLTSQIVRYCYSRRRKTFYLNTRRDPIFAPVNPIAINRNSLRESLRVMRSPVFLQQSDSFEHFAFEERRIVKNNDNEMKTLTPNQIPPTHAHTTTESSSDTNMITEPIPIMLPCIDHVNLTIPSKHDIAICNKEFTNTVEECPPAIPPKRADNQKQAPLVAPKPKRYIPVPAKLPNKEKRPTILTLGDKQSIKKENNATVSIPNLDPMTGMPLHANDQTDNVDRSSNAEVRSYLRKKISDINKQTLAMANYDDMKVYCDEGTNMSLKSLGSLHDIVHDEEDDDEEVKIVKMEVCMNDYNHHPVSSSPLLLSYSPAKKVVGVRNRVESSPKVLRKAISSTKRMRMSEREKENLTKQFSGNTTQWGNITTSQV